MSVRELRDVLRERAGGPSPANPYRHEQVRARIRRTRVRRTAAAGAVAVAVAVVAAYLIPGQAGPVPLRAPAAARPGLPERFTSPDGTEYRRVGLVTLTGTEASIDVPVSGKPLEVATWCDGSLNRMPVVYVNSRRVHAPGYGCGDGLPRLVPVDVPKGSTEATLTFDRSAEGCVSLTEDGPCVPEQPDTAVRDVGVYEWTPPAMAVEPPRIKALPPEVDRLRLAGSASGRWPGATSFTLTGRGAGTVTVHLLCSGDLAQRMWFKFWVGGVEGRTRLGCSSWTRGPFPDAGMELEVPRGEQVTVTVRTGMWGEYTNRPVRWSAGLYVR
ncbi:hypothetical protein ACWDA3_01940 [Nonomuraea rubra]